MIKRISELFSIKPANTDLPLDLHVKGVLRSVKYKNMTVEAAAAAIISAITEHEDKALSEAKGVIRFLQRELQINGRQIL